MTLVIIVFSAAQARAAEGKVERLYINTPSLSNNTLDYKETQEIAVYLPPSYSDSLLQYPVVYFLTGFGDKVNYYRN